MNHWVQGPNCQRFFWGVLFFFAMTHQLTTSQPLTKTQLRRQLRQRRRQLSPQQQRTASRQLERLLSRDMRFIKSQHIAFYLANDGEINPKPLLDRALKMKKHCYLPVLNGKKLWFARYCKGDKLINNRFGIPEPRNKHRRLPAKSLSMVLMPLVGFDSHGGRLGMGGGFYDRTFSWLNTQAVTRRPVLMGLAHDCQKVEQLALQSWDIALTAIATDKELIETKRNSA